MGHLQARPATGSRGDPGRHPPRPEPARPRLAPGALVRLPHRGHRRAEGAGPDRAGAVHVPHRPLARPRPAAGPRPQGGRDQPGLDHRADRPRAACSPSGSTPVSAAGSTASASSCSWAPPWPSPPSRCWPGSSRRPGSPTPRSASLTITCAAVDDVTAWCLLAVVVAISRLVGTSASAALTIAACRWSFLVDRCCGSSSRCSAGCRAPPVWLAICLALMAPGPPSRSASTPSSAPSWPGSVMPRRGRWPVARSTSSSSTSRSRSCCPCSSSWSGWPPGSTCSTPATSGGSPRWSSPTAIAGKLGRVDARGPGDG